MKKYILASDYDGTLCRNGRITEDDIKAINEFRLMGNLFGIVSGRDYVKGFEFFKRNAEFSFDFIVACNGAVAYDKVGNIYFAEMINGKQPFRQTTLAQELIRQILKLTSNPCGISFAKERYDFHPEFTSGAKVGNIQYRDFSILKNVDSFVLSNAMCDTAKRAGEVVRTIGEQFGDYVNPSQNGICIDISLAGVDKATGITKLSDCLGISHENVWTIGDNFNDIPMIEKFHGCAISSGVEALKKVAEYVCDSVHDAINVILRKKQL